MDHQKAKRQEDPYLDLNVRLMSLAGLWPNSGPRYFLYIIHAFYTLIFGVFFVSTIYQLYTDPMNVEAVTECLEAVWTVSSSTMKAASFVVLRRRWQLLVAQVRAHMGREGDDGRVRKRLRQSDRQTRSFSVTLSALAFACIFLLAARAPLEEVLGWVKGAPPSPSSERLLIRMIVPGTRDPSVPVFWALYALHVIIGITQVIFLPTCDGMIVGLIQHARVHMSAVQEDFLALPDIEGKGEGSRRELKEGLAKCVRQHKRVLQFVVDLESLLHPLMLLQFVGSTICICATAFQAFKATDTMRMLSQISFFIATLIQFGTYCLHGDRLKEESEKVAMAAYGSPWFGSGHDHGRSLLFVIARCRRPARLTVGKFADLSLRTYGEVVKGSFTYFMLLKEMSD